MISSVTDTALYGMSKSLQVFNRAANNLLSGTASKEAAINHNNADNQRTAQKQSDVQIKISDPQAIVIDNAQIPGNSVIADVVNMNMAKISYAASTKLFKTADEMSKTVLDI